MKDRFFLFGDYEGLRQVKAVSQIAQTLTANDRLGIVNDETAILFLALVGACPVPQLDESGSGQGVVCVDNTMEKLVSPSGTPARRSGTASQWCRTGARQQRRAILHRRQSKGDRQLRHGSRRPQDQRQRQPDWHLVSRSLDMDQAGHSTRTSTGSTYRTPPRLGGNHIFNSAMVNTLRLGYSRSDLRSPAISTLTALERHYVGMLPGCTAPGVNIGAGGLSANSATATGFGRFTEPRVSTLTPDFKWSTTISRTTGKHNLKFGFMFFDNHQNWGQGAGCGGSASFNPLQTFFRTYPPRSACRPSPVYQRAHHPSLSSKDVRRILSGRLEVPF